MSDCPVVFKAGHCGSVLVVLPRDVVDKPHRLHVGVGEVHLRLVGAHVAPDFLRVDFVVCDPVVHPHGIATRVALGEVGHDGRVGVDGFG